MATKTKSHGREHTGPRGLLANPSFSHPIPVSSSKGLLGVDGGHQRVAHRNLVGDGGRVPGWSLRPHRDVGSGGKSPPGSGIPPMDDGGRGVDCFAKKNWSEKGSGVRDRACFRGLGPSPLHPEGGGGRGGVKPAHTQRTGDKYRFGYGLKILRPYILPRAIAKVVSPRCEGGHWGSIVHKLVL